MARIQLLNVVQRVAVKSTPIICFIVLLFTQLFQNATSQEILNKILAGNENIVECIYMCKNSFENLLCSSGFENIWVFKRWHEGLGASHTLINPIIKKTFD
jgi:hypothetical protein